MILHRPFPVFPDSIVRFPEPSGGSETVSGNIGKRMEVEAVDNDDGIIDDPENSKPASEKAVIHVPVLEKLRENCHFDAVRNVQSD